MKHLFVLPALLLIVSVYSQNLVPNPGFEEYKKLPNIWTRSAKEFDNAMISWSTPNNTIPDIISTHVEEKFWANPNNKKQSSGRQMPRSGNNMIGLRTSSPGDNGAVACWHEYVQAKLNKPLQPGKEYYVEFWVADAIRGSNSTNNLGVLFTNKQIKTGNRLSLLYTPHINECKIIKSKDWYKISGFYKPDSIKNYIIIGNFYHDMQTKSVKHEGKVQGGYYYVDDVLVREKTTDDVATACKPEKMIIPAEKKPEQADKPDIASSQKEITQIDYKVGETIKLDNIFFKTDKSVLLPESITELDKLVKIMTDNTSLKIEINGHTDNVGTDEYNMKLSRNRAKAVVKYLTEHGVDSERLNYKGYGSTKPVATNYTEEGRALNRRVEFRITAK